MKKILSCIIGGLMFVSSHVTLAATGPQGTAAISLAAGTQHTCALTGNSGVQCWGYNGYGQLGNNSTINSNIPVAVSNLSSGVVQVSAGHQHSCALLAGGSVQCWGLNTNGQLGDGTTTFSKIPVNVQGVSGAVQISAGTSHSCALLSTGGVKCWGDNYYGGLGDGTTTQRLTAVDVLGVAGASGVAAGTLHSCALLNNGQVQCWGYNGYGELGNGVTGTTQSTRVTVSGLTDAASITAGLYYTCVKTTSGTAKCWGFNAYGQLGNGGTATATTPVTVPNLAEVVQITASVNSQSTCAVVAGGIAKCWGLNNNGQLDTGDTSTRLVPTNTSGLSGAVNSIVVGTTHGCAIDGAGVQCWGANSLGQLGAGNTVPTNFPQNVVGLSGAAPVITPTAISPVTTHYPVYTWKAVPGATSYYVRVNYGLDAVITTYTAAQVNCADGIGLCTVTSGFVAPGQYSWQVQPFNDFGAGNWSELLSFSIPN